MLYLIKEYLWVIFHSPRRSSIFVTSGLIVKKNTSYFILSFFVTFVKSSILVMLNNYKKLCLKYFFFICNW